jgi:hypothetical protein
MVLISNSFCFESYAQRSATDLQRLLTIPLQYTVFKTSEKMEIDGKDDEPAWAKASWTPVFSDIATGQAPDEQHEAKCKMLWDDDFLYVYADITEPIYGHPSQKPIALYSRIMLWKCLFRRRAELTIMWNFR